MFSYNNIIEKGEPDDIQPIEEALEQLKSEKENPIVSQQKLLGADCIVVDNFLSADECDAIVHACETVGFTFWAQKNHYDEKEHDENTETVRNVDTIEAKFPKLSSVLTDRIQKIVNLEPKFFSPEMELADELFERDLVGEWRPYSLSENLLLGRYHPGGHFMPHIDGSTIVDLNTRSMYTLLVYLNDVEEGGETFLLSGDQCKVTSFDVESGTLRGNKESRIGCVYPRKGSAAFFYHSLLHEGAPVVRGVKYICRADLLYRRHPPILASPKDVEAFRLYEKARMEESNGNVVEACKMFQLVRKISRGVAELYQID